MALLVVVAFDWMPLLWATAGASFSAACFGLYAHFNQPEGSADSDLVVIAFVATWLGFLTALRPHWMW